MEYVLFGQVRTLDAQTERVRTLDAQTERAIPTPFKADPHKFWVLALAGGEAFVDFVEERNDDSRIDIRIPHHAREKRCEHESNVLIGVVIHERSVLQVLCSNTQAFREGLLDFREGRLKFGELALVSCVVIELVHLLEALLHFLVHRDVQLEERKQLVSWALVQKLVCLPSQMCSSF